MFDKKTVYHSALVAAGTITVTITSEPTQSKFKKEQRFVAFKVDGGGEHQYICENEQCQKALEGLKGKKVQLTAEGSRDEAEIHVVADNGAPVARQQQRTAQRETGPAKGRQEPPSGNAPSKAEKEAAEFAAFAKAKVYAGRCRVLWDICAKHASLSMEGVYGKTADIPAQLRADLHMRLATTLFIETKQQTDINELPVKWINTHGDTKPVEPPPPPPKPEPANIEDDDIPF